MTSTRSTLIVIGAVILSAYVGCLAGASLQGAPDARLAFPHSQRESAAALADWNAYGCDSDQSCARLEHWIRTRYHFDCSEGGGV